MEIAKNDIEQPTFDFLLEVKIAELDCPNTAPRHEKIARMTENSRIACEQFKERLLLSAVMKEMPEASLEEIQQEMEEIELYGVADETRARITEITKLRPLGNLFPIMHGYTTLKGFLHLMQMQKDPENGIRHIEFNERVFACASSIYTEIEKEAAKQGIHIRKNDERIELLTETEIPTDSSAPQSPA